MLFLATRQSQNLFQLHRPRRAVLALTGAWNHGAIDRKWRGLVEDLGVLARPILLARSENGHQCWIPLWFYMF